MKIKDIAKLVSGQVINRVEARKDSDNICGNIKIIVPKAIKNGKINLYNLSEINLRTEIDKNKLTKVGDIVLKLSQPYDAAYVSENDEGILITSFFLLIRDLKYNINPKYLVELINSGVYKEQAIALTSGTTIPMLTKGKVEQIDFEILNHVEQERIVKISDNIKYKEEIFREIIDLEKQKLENILRGEI